MPANAVDDFALQLVTVKQGIEESVSAYATRFRQLSDHCSSAVRRAGGTRDSSDALRIVLWQDDLKLTTSVLQLAADTFAASSLKQAADRARLHETVGLRQCERPDVHTLEPLISSRWRR